jgi:hypothetical protein
LGTITVASLRRSLPVSTERRLAEFTELLATAISDTQAHEELRRLADTQSALRRVATLVAREASQTEVFTAIADECRALFGVGQSEMIRYEAGPSHVVVASSASSTRLYPVGSRHPLRDGGVATRVLRTGRPVRSDGDRPAERGDTGGRHPVRDRGAHRRRGPDLGRHGHGNARRPAAAAHRVAHR